MDLIAALGSLASQRIFVVYRLVAKPNATKLDKLPLDVITGHANLDAQDPANWITAHEAALWATQYGLDRHGVGIVISEDSGLFCIDLDACLEPAGWSAWALSVCARFPGAYQELSVSGQALHIMGRYTGTVQPHSSKNIPLHTEAYTRRRFIALTGTGACGSIESDHTAALAALLTEYFPPRPEGGGSKEWTTEPVPQWAGPADDAELINRAVRSHGAGSVFGGKAAFIDLWTANADRLPHAFPPQSDAWPWDRSSADQAFANHLAFWTGSNCERMARLMKNSALRRDKWEREEYFNGTILHACATQKEWYKDRTLAQTAGPPSASEGPPVLVAGSPDGSKPTSSPLEPQTLAPPAASGVPIPSGPLPSTTGPILDGVNLPTATQLQPRECPPPGTLVTSTDQQLMFDGCVYVEDLNMVMTPDGIPLESQRFDNRFPGITFITTPDGTKPTRSAWEAFVQSEVVAFPKVRGLYFMPTEAPGAIVLRDGMRFLNSWVPSDIASTPGDYTPFWDHLRKLLPKGRDAEILLYYMAAVVQYPGRKFTWWPFVQGVPGNGKSFICEALQNCIGHRHTHAADASKIGGKFNAAFYGKIFVRVDEVKIDHQRGNVWESLKLLVSQTSLEIEPKGVDSVSREVCFNGVLLSNYKNGVRKTDDDRRICPLFCAQQVKSDLYRDGMADDLDATRSTYFDALWAWAENGGWAVINWFLQNIKIPSELNPAASCRRAPDTTSTKEAIQEGWGVAEQEVAEAISAGYEGFRGGWVSSSSLDSLLGRIGKENAIPRRARGQLLHTLGYVLHPALPNGRSPVKFPDGSQPVLYMKAEHEALKLDSVLGVVNAFQQAQKTK